MDCDNYIFLFGNLLEYNDNIISDLDKNKIFKNKTKIGHIIL